MTTDRKLAWIGLFLGLAGILPLFKDAPIAASLVLMLLAAVAGYLSFEEYRGTRTTITTLSVRKVLTVHDAAGKDATYRNEQKVRINFGPVSEIWFRNMVSDGCYSNITINGNHPTGQEAMGCLISYSKRFNPPLFRGQVKEVALECTVTDAFTAKDEGLSHEVTQNTRLLTLEVNLPRARPCLNASLCLEAGGEPAKLLSPPEISEDRCQIKTTVKAPKAGYCYNLQWNW